MYERKDPNHPCTNCKVGWYSYDTDNYEATMKTCHDECKKLAKYLRAKNKSKTPVR